MPPQTNSNDDDKYGLATATDDYGLEPAGKAATAPSGEDTDAYLKRLAGEPLATEKNLPGSTPKLRDAVNKGIVPMKPPTQFETEHSPEPQNVGTWGRIKEYGRGLGNIVGGVAGMITDMGDIGAPEHLARQAASIAMADQERKQEGRSLPYRIAAGGAGLAGVDPSGMERAAEHGDPAGVGIEAAVQATPLAIGEASRLKKGRVAPMEPPTPPEVDAALVEHKAAAPPKKENLNYDQNFKRSAPHLAEEARISPVTNVREAYDASRNALSKIDQQVKAAAADMKGETIDGDAIMDKARESVNASKRTPEEHAAATKLLDGLGVKGRIPLEDSIQILERLNKELDGAYDMTGSDRDTLMKTNPVFAADYGAAAALREHIFSKFSDRGLPGVADLRRDQAALMEMRDHYRDNIVKSEAADAKPLPATKGQKIAGGLGAGLGALTGGGVGGAVLGPGGAVAGGLAGREVGRVAGEGIAGKFATDNRPNARIARSFDMLKNSGIQAPRLGMPTPVPAPAGLLPAPATEAGWTPAQDTSGAVRGGRWTTPAGLLPGPNKGLLPGIGETGRGIEGLPLPGTTELAHPEMFPRQSGTGVPETTVQRGKGGRMAKVFQGTSKPRVVGQTAEGGPIYEGEKPAGTKLGKIGEERRDLSPEGQQRRKEYTEPDLPGLVEKLKPVGARETPVYEGTRQDLAERTKPEVKHMVKPTETEETRAEAKKKDEKELEPIEYTKPMKMAPSKLRPLAGTTEESVHHHELAHVIVGALNGMEPGAIISHRNPTIGRGATAAALFDLREYTNPRGYMRRALGLFSRDVPEVKATNLTDMLAAGAAANEAIDGVPRDKNVGLYGDKGMAKKLFEALDFPSSKHEELWNAAVDRAKEKLTPEIQEIIKDEATRREDNLPVEYHYSANRIKHIIERVRSLHEQTPVDVETGTTETGGRGSEEAVAGREGAGTQESRSSTAKEKLKPFKPPQRLYSFKVERPGTPSETMELQATDRKTAWKKLDKKIGGSAHYTEMLSEGPMPEVGPPTQLEPIAFKELRKNPLVKDVAGEEGEGRVKVPDIGRMIGDYAKKKVGKIGKNEAVEHAIKMAAPEIKYQMATDNSGLGWYDKDTQKAVDAMKELHPELKDPKKAAFFKTFWSALSYGKNPADNLMLADRAYSLYKKTGKMPITQPDGTVWGVYKAGHEGNLKNTQALVDKYGEAGTVDWLTSKHPTSELKEWNKNVKGKKTDEQYGAKIYGPKGGNFYLNLNGVPDLVTVDKWMARTWRRWTGTLTAKNVNNPPSPVEIRNTQAAVKKVADKLGIEPRDAQAVLWYYEQELYKAHGATSEALSYGNEARKLVEERRNVQPKGNAGKGGGAQIFKKAAKH